MTEEKKVMEKEIKKEFLVLRLRRTEEGLKVYLRSEKLETFWQKAAKGVVREYNPPYIIKGREEDRIEGYPFPETLPGKIEKTFFNKIEKGLFYDGEPNFSFSRLRGVGEGITILFPEPYSKTAIKRWVEELKKSIQIFVHEYLKPIEIEIVINEKGEEA